MSMEVYQLERAAHCADGSAHQKGAQHVFAKRRRRGDFLDIGKIFLFAHIHGIILQKQYRLYGVVFAPKRGIMRETAGKARFLLRREEVPYYNKSKERKGRQENFCAKK